MTLATNEFYRGGIKMIEIIYKDDSEKNKTDTVIKLPKNIRQIGDVGSDYQIYVEDNVMSYLKKLPEKENDIRYGVLLGNVKYGYGYTYIFISAAIDVDEVVENTVIFSDEVWSDINDHIRRFFSDLNVVGWFTSLNYSLNSDMPYLGRIHLDNFAGNDKLYLKLDRTEEEENFYIYGQTGLVKISGYHIYYDKNNNMDDYIFGTEITKKFQQVNVRKQLDKNKELFSKGKYGIDENLQRVKNVSDDKNKDTKNKVVKSTNLEKTAQKLSRNIASVLMVLALVATVAIVSDKDTMENIKSKLTSLISGQKESTEYMIPVNGVINETTSVIMPTENSVVTETTLAQETEIITIVNEETTTQTETVSETITANVEPIERTYYTVEKGDTLYSIAVEIYNDQTKVTDIMQANGIENADHVEVGDKLLLP